MSIETIITALKAQYPTIRVGSDESGYTELVGADYDAKITEWANNQLAQDVVTTEATRIAGLKTSITAKRMSATWIPFTQEEVDYLNSQGL